MYAVVSTGGKQLKVEKGAEAVVERLSADVGAVVSLDVLLVADGERVMVHPDEVAAASVTAEVVEHFRGSKAVVFKFKKRKGYKRLKGHRQEQTRLRITDITLSGGGRETAVAERPRKTVVADADETACAPEVEAAPTHQEAVEERCAAVKGTGEPCANKAKPGSEYCGVHAKKHGQ
ncbi:MAG TPA: 50S ribosomal protein L21 [Coriobacteriia bacterium]|nr:50S ribosomal protein L21 [Coriobacteriia bacterium]